MFYSASTGGFYDTDIHGQNIPADAVKITADLHATLLDGQTAGKLIKSDVNGIPVLVEPPAPTDADVAAQVRAERDVKMRAFEWRYERNSRETRLGLPATDRLADLDRYMQALANVPEQPGFPRDVVWPVL